MSQDSRGHVLGTLRLGLDRTPRDHVNNARVVTVPVNKKRCDESVEGKREEGYTSLGLDLGTQRVNLRYLSRRLGRVKNSVLFLLHF